MSSPQPFPSVRAFQLFIEEEFKAFKKWFKGDAKNPGIIESHITFFAQLNELEDWVSRLTLGWIRTDKHSNEAQNGFYEQILRLREAQYELFRPARSPYSKLKAYLSISEEEERGLSITERHARRWEAIKTLFVIDLFTFIRIGVDNRIQWQVAQIEKRLEKQAENPFSQIANVYRLKGGQRTERSRFAPKRMG